MAVFISRLNTYYTYKYMVYMIKKTCACVLCLKVYSVYALSKCMPNRVMCREFLPFRDG